jgi:hypothetical protein
VHNLKLANDGPRKGHKSVLDGSSSEYNIVEKITYPVNSLHLTKLERHLIVGLQSGEIRVLAHDGNYLRYRLQRKLTELGIL